MSIKAIAFDLDGVLVNAMALHEEAFCAAVRLAGKVSFGVEDHRPLAGLPTKTKLRHLVERGIIKTQDQEAIAKQKQALTLEYISQRCRPDRKRAALLAHLVSRKIKVGVVTNCSRLATMRMLEYTQLAPHIAAIVTNEDVPAPKPDPSGYHAICGMLQAAPTETLAIEDHPRGVEAASKAGLHVAVLHQFDDLDLEFVEDAIQRMETQCPPSALA